MQAYEHASDLIGVFREVRMGIETLVQIDRLVQILETPVFTFMRLHLLQPLRYPALLRSDDVLGTIFSLAKVASQACFRGLPDVLS